MSKDTLPAKRLENALTKLQDALSALKLAGEELAIVEASMIGDDAHRRLIMESSRENPIGTADDIQSHREQAIEIAEHAADVAKAAASALRAISEALRVQATATKYTTGALAPDVSAAIHAADEECKP